VIANISILFSVAKLETEIALFLMDRTFNEVMLNRGSLLMLIGIKFFKFAEVCNACCFLTFFLPKPVIIGIVIGNYVS